MAYDSIKTLFDYISDVIKACEVIPTAEKLPSFQELRSSPDDFYERFSVVTYKYNIICDTLQKLQYSNAMIIKAINELMNIDNKADYAVRQQYIKCFTNIKSECIALIACYETAKASAEAVVKFYNNAQYILTTNRFDASVSY